MRRALRMFGALRGRDGLPQAGIDVLGSGREVVDSEQRRNARQTTDQHRRHQKKRRPAEPVERGGSFILRRLRGFCFECEEQMLCDPGLLQDTQEVVALLDRGDLAGRLIAQLLPAVRERGDRLGKPLLFIERQRVGVGFCDPLDGCVELVELPFGVRQNLRAIRRRQLERDCGEIDKALRSLVDDVACKLHVRDGLFDLGDAAAQMPQLHYAKRHRDSGRTKCQGHRSDEQHLDVGEALHFLSGARKNDLQFQRGSAP